ASAAMPARTPCPNATRPRRIDPLLADTPQRPRRSCDTSAGLWRVVDLPTVPGRPPEPPRPYRAKRPATTVAATAWLTKPKKAGQIRRLCGRGVAEPAIWRGMTLGRHPGAYAESAN